ncbi:mannan endo-1,4-beta-mannosidase 5-like [Punica granatum]|uniref:mannan endo-1,4-beta-mannosidase n=2 Tax=Punica granatum TaxID=22663 RepID=A0A6P8DR13_PUNGR|nr:mannan endo-1,4-beta-mannosidase 5-like [Punica granatum]
MAGFRRSVLFLRTITLFVIIAAILCCGDARKLHKHHRNRNKNDDNYNEEVATPLVEGFVQVRGTQFELNGSPFLFNGFNSYWMMNVATEPADWDKVSNVFHEASAAGLTVCRTWAFRDGGDRALQSSPGVYDERVFQALDFVTSEARRYGIRLILSLTNNYHDFGGRPQYVQWARNAGATINGDDDFYTNDVVKGYYRNHVQKVLTRVNTITGIAYRDDPTVMAWELMNEPRCQVDYSGNTVNEWVQEMAPYVKSIDNKHLLAVGMEGFYGDSVPDRKQYNPGYQVGTDFIKSNLVKEIDFGTIHAYPDVWLSGQDENAQTNFVQRWMDSHLEDSRTNIGKPLVFTEFGKSKKDPDYSLDVRDSYMSDVYADIYDLARNGGAFGGGLVWQILAEGMDSYDDGYEIVLSQEPSTTSLIAQQSSKMASLEHML